MPSIRRAEPADTYAELYWQLVSNTAISVQAERISAISEDPDTALFVCTLGCTHLTFLGQKATLSVDLTSDGQTCMVDQPQEVQ
jgi:hypothetical protein